MLSSARRIVTLALAAAFVLCPIQTLLADGEVGEPPISAPFSGCGEIVHDEICEKLFQLEDGSHDTFPGIENFAIGERIFVVGDVCLTCLLTECGSFYSALFNAIVLECATTGGEPPIPVQECMQVVIDLNCGPMLEDGDGAVDGADLAALLAAWG